MKSALKKSSDCAKITCAGYTVKLKTDLATLLTLPPEETPAPFVFRENHQFKDDEAPLFLAGFSNDWKKHIKTKGWLKSPENAHTWLGICVRKDDEMHLTIRKGKLKQAQFKAAIKKNAALKKLTWHITEAIQEGEDDDLLNDDLHESDEDEPQKTPAQSEMLQQQAHTFQTELVDLLKQLKGATPEAKRVILGNVEQIAAQLYQIPNWQKYTNDKVEGYLEQVETFLAQQNKEDSPSLASELNRIHRLIEQEAAAFKTATSKEDKTAILGKIVKLLQQWDTTAESATPEDFTNEQRVEIPTIKAQIKKIAPNASIKEDSIPSTEPQKIPIDIRIAKLAPITLTVPLSYSIEDVINELLSGGGAEYRKEILSVVIESTSGTQLKPVSNYKATLADYGIQAHQSLRLRVEQEGLLGGTPLWEIAIASAFAAGIFLLIYLGSKYFGKRSPKNLQVTVHVHNLPTFVVSALDTDTVQNILDKVSTTNLQQVTALSIGGIDVTGRRGETLQQLGIQDDTNLHWEFEPNLANITTWANAVWVETPTHASTLLVENIITTNNITADLTLWNQVKAYNNVCAKLQTFVLANDQTNIATIQAAINKLTINSLDASAALMDAALKWGDDNTLEALSECSPNQLTAFNTLTNNGLIGHLRSLPKDDRLNILTALESKSALESTFAKLANNNNLAKFLQCSTEQLTAFNSLDDNNSIKHIEGLDESKIKTTLDALQNLTELPKTFTKLTDKANLEKFLQCSTEQLAAFNSLDAGNDNDFIKHIEGLDESKFKTMLNALQNLTELPKTFTKLTDKANLEKFLQCSKEQLAAFNSLDAGNDNDFIKHIEGLDESKFKTTLDALQNLAELPKIFTKLTDKANLEKFLQCSTEQLTAFNSLDAVNDNDFIKHIEGLDESKFKTTLDALQNLAELPKIFTKLTDKANLEKFLQCSTEQLTAFNSLDAVNDNDFIKHIEGLDESKFKTTLDALQNLTELPKTFTKLTDKANLEKFLQCSKEQLAAFNSLDAGNDNDFIKHIEGLDENKFKTTLDALQNLTELPKTFTKLTDKANLEKFFTADNNDLKVFNTLDTFNSSKITKFADLHKFIEDKSDANAVKDLLGKLTANGSLINIWELLAANVHNANANFDKFTGLAVAEAENYLTIMTNSKNGTIIHAKRPNIQTAVLSLAAPDIPQFITDFVHDTTGALTFINDIKTTYPMAVRATPQKFIETWKELASTPATSTQRSKKLFFEEIYNVEEKSHAGVFNDIEDHTRGVIVAGVAKGGHFLGSAALQPVTPPPPPSTWIYPPDNTLIHIDTTKIKIGTPADPVKVKVNGSKINGTLKAEVATYFPRGWSMNKILAEIAFALANGNTMTDGQTLIIWKKGKVVESAYPKK